MRIVHARKRVFGKDFAFEKKFSLLVWILSILKWKKTGNEIVLYTDDITLEEIKKIGFEDLYDEINTELFEKGDICKTINFKWFWAMPKILALHYETFHLGNKPVISDMDVVPMQDLSRFWDKADVTVWSNKEFVEFKGAYPQLYKLSLPKDYKLPNWFTGNAKPLNTGVIHFKNNDIAKMYCDEVFKYVQNNENEKNNSVVVTMVNAEQRMLGEIIKYKDLRFNVIQPINKGLFNKNAFHTHGYKRLLNDSNTLQWNTNLLLMIKDLSETTFKKLIERENFAPEREYFEKNGYICEEIKQFTIYKNNN